MIESHDNNLHSSSINVTSGTKNSCIITQQLKLKRIRLSTLLIDEHYDIVVFHYYRSIQ